MRSQDQQTTSLAAPRLARRYTRRIAGKTLAVVVLDFLAFRVFGPELIDMHQDLALIGALACFAGALFATGWLVFQIRLDLARYQLERRDLSPALPLSNEE